jgi:hypothetical protein
MKTFLAIVSVIGLAGCAEWGAIKSGVASHGTKAADEQLEVAEWGICKATTIGAWMRRYGSDAEKKAAWAKLCTDNAIAP